MGMGNITSIKCNNRFFLGICNFYLSIIYKVNLMRKFILKIYFLEMTIKYQNYIKIATFLLEFSKQNDFKNSKINLIFNKKININF